MCCGPSGETAVPILAKPSLTMADRDLLVDMLTAEDALMNEKSVGFASIDHGGGAIMVNPTMRGCAASGK